ncbi:HEPN domain-containing protein [Archaeoglobus sp.]
MEEYSLYLDRAKKAFEAFKILKERKLYEDALSRGYYAIIHLCFAILIKTDIEIPKTHSGLIAKLWNNREKLGIDEEIVKNISRLQSLRESGDYSAVPSVDENDLTLVEKTFERLREIV